MAVRAKKIRRCEFALRGDGRDASGDLPVSVAIQYSYSLQTFERAAGESGGGDFNSFVKNPVHFLVLVF
jgi:hypothetical protein